MVNVNCRVEKSSIVDKTTGVLEPEQRFEERYAAGIIKVAETVKNGTIPVRMLNPHPKALRMYKESTVGQLYPPRRWSRTGNKIVLSRRAPGGVPGTNVLPRSPRTVAPPGFYFGGAN